MQEKNLYYFVSDVHLGMKTKDAREHEAKFVSFLDGLPSNTKALYLLGDIFDFWYEYKHVIPSGHTRVLGRLAQLADSGVEVFFFKGNHDLWAYGYFEKEIGMIVLPQPSVVEIEGTKFCLGHGDGLGKISFGFKLIRGMFYNRALQMLFSTIHPRWALGIGYAWSRHSANKRCKNKAQYVFQREKTPIYKFANDYGTYLRSATGESIDYYIFGHYHAATQMDVASGGKMIILGDWIAAEPAYLVFDGESISFRGGFKF